MDCAVKWLRLDIDSNPFKYKSFNTRYDKLNIKGTEGYQAYCNSRCVIPAKGYGETEYVNDKPLHYRDLIAKDGTILLGGLCREWVNNNTGESALSCSMITLPPLPKLKKVHTKASPLLLPRDLALVNRWLDESITDTDEFAALLQPHIPDDLLAQQIDKPSTYQPVTSIPYWGWASWLVFFELTSMLVNVIYKPSFSQNKNGQYLRMNCMRHLIPLALTLFILLPCRAVAEPVTTSVAIEQLRGVINETISKAEASGNFLLMRAAQDALLVLHGFEKSSNAVLDKAFDEISQERQDIFNNINTLVIGLQDGINQSTDKIQSTVDQFDRLAREVTFRDFPTIYRHRGGIIIPDAQKNTLLVFEGYNLNKGNPSLRINDNTYYPSTSPNTLTFTIPKASFNFAETELNYSIASLTTYEETGGFLGFFTKLSAVEYDITVTTLPRKLGLVTITYKSTTSTPNSRTISEEVSHNSSSKGWDCRSFSYSPAGLNREFDPVNSSVTRGSGNSRGDLRNVHIHERGASFSICAKRRWHDKDNGYRHAKVKLIERWTEHQEGKVSVERPLGWDSDEVFNAEKTGTNFVATFIEYSSQRSFSRIDSGLLGDFAEYQENANDKTFIVKPRIPAYLKGL